MRIAFTSYRFSPEVGGIEVNSEILARRFAESGCEVTPLTYSPTQGEDDYPFGVVRAPSALTEFSLQRAADIVYQNNISLPMLWPALLMRKPVVISVRTWIRRPDGRRTMADWFKLRILHRAAGVIYISRAVAEDTGVPGVVIGNPYRDELFRNLVPDDQRPSDIVFVGRLVSDKGVDVLLNAVGILRKAGISLKVTVVGAGPEAGSLRSMASELGIGNDVAFVGERSGTELVEMINRHTVIVVPSRWPEPFGNVALEGLACGCVPVVSSGGGLPDAIGPCGIVFESGNPDALADHLGRLCRDSALRSSFLSPSGPHLAQHTERAVAERYLKVIRAAQ